MKYLNNFNNFSEISEGRLAIKDFEIRNGKEILNYEKKLLDSAARFITTQLIDDSLSVSKYPQDVIKFSLPKNMDKKTYALTPKDLAGGLDGQTWINNYISNAKQGKIIGNYQGYNSNIIYHNPVKENIIYNKDINAFTTEDGSGCVSIWVSDLDEKTAANAGCGVFVFDKNGKCLFVPDWTNCVIRLNLNWLNKMKDAYKKCKEDLSTEYLSNNISEVILSTLYHEFIHTKDPDKFYGGMKGYRSDSDKEYYGSIGEFLSMSGEILEIILRRADDFLSVIINSKHKDKQKILDITEWCLQSIMDYFTWDSEFKAGKLPPEAVIFFLENDWPDILKKIEKENPKYTGLANYFVDRSGGHFNFTFKFFQWNFEKVRRNIKYNPKIWKNFTSDLYKTIKEAEDIINNTPDLFYDDVKKISIGGKIRTKFPYGGKLSDMYSGYTVPYKW
jgi:hypothetical protein